MARYFSQMKISNITISQYWSIALLKYCSIAIEKSTRKYQRAEDGSHGLKIFVKNITH